MSRCPMSLSERSEPSKPHTFRRLVSIHKSTLHGFAPQANLFGHVGFVAKGETLCTLRMVVVTTIPPYFLEDLQMEPLVILYLGHLY